MADGGNVIFRFTGDTSQLNNSINSLSKSVGSTFTKLGSTIAGISAGMVAGLSSAINRFDTLNNYPKVLSNLGIGGDEAKESIEELSEAIDGLPTSLNDAALGVQRLVAKNKDVKKSTRYFTALNDAIVAGSAPAELQASAIEQLTQAYTKGKPDMMEWRSMMSAMSGQLDQVAQAMNMVSTDELYDALKTGRISMDDFMDTLVELDENGSEAFQSFSEQARNSTDSIGTAIVNVKNRVQKGFASMLESINKASKDTSLGSISDNINKLSKALQYLLDWFGQALKGNRNFTSMIENIAKGIDKITKSIKRIDVKKMDKFVDIALGLGKLSPILIGVGKVLPKVTGKITSFSGKISKIFGTTIPSVIGGAFSSAVVLSAVIGSLGILEETTNGRLTEIINDIGQKLPGMLQNVLNFVNTRLPSILQRGTIVFQNIMNTLIQNSPTIMNIIMTALTQFTTTLMTNLPIMVQGLITFLTSAVQGLIPQIPTLLQTFVNGILDTLIVLTSPENLTKMLDVALNLIVKLGTSLAEMVGSDEFWEKVSQVIEGLVTFLTDPENLTKIAEAGIQLIDALGKGLIKGVPRLVMSISKVFASLLEPISLNLMKLYIQIWGWLKGYNQDTIDKLKTELVDNHGHQLYQAMQKTGWNTVTGFVDGIAEGKGNVSEASKDTMQTAINTAEDTAQINSPSRVFADIGSNLIQGLINGLWNRAGSLFSTIWTIASRTISNMKSALGIHSPSKEFAELGMFSMQGYEQGFLKELPDVQRNMQAGMGRILGDLDYSAIQNQINGSFGLSPRLNQTINSQSPTVNVSVQNNMKTDFMGNIVNDIKTYSNGSRNDYNYGAV